MEKTWISFCLVCFFLCKCSPKDCYEIKLQFRQESNLTTSSPILIENGIVGFVENLDKSKKGSQVSVCIPNPIKIPKDSKVFAGYIDRLGFGIQIIRGTQEEFFDTGDIVSGVYKDTIMLENANVDSLLIKKLEDVTNDINGRRKRR